MVVTDGGTVGYFQMGMGRKGMGEQFPYFEIAVRRSLAVLPVSEFLLLVELFPCAEVSFVGAFRSAQQRENASPLIGMRWVRDM